MEFEGCSKYIIRDWVPMVLSHEKTLPNNYQVLPSQRDEWLVWLKTQDFTHLVTLTCPIHAGYAGGKWRLDPIVAFWRRLLKELAGVIDFRFLRLGKRYFEKQPDQRVFFIAFPEQLATNPHYHLLVRFPSKDLREYKFNNNLSVAWKEISGVKSANLNDNFVSAKCDRISEDNESVIDYVLKEGWNSENLDNIILSSQFHPIR